MVIAKNALEHRANQTPSELAQFGDSTHDDLPAYSTQTLGVRLLLGLGLGLIASLNRCTKTFPTAGAAVRPVPLAALCDQLSPWARVEINGGCA
jgi:hypothetical protein